MELVCAINSSVDSRIDESNSVEFPPNRVHESVDELLILLGNENGLRLAYSVITKVVIHFFKVPSYPFAVLQPAFSDTPV